MDSVLPPHNRALLRRRYLANKLGFTTIRTNLKMRKYLNLLEINPSQSMLLSWGMSATWTTNIKPSICLKRLYSPVIVQEKKLNVRKKAKIAYFYGTIWGDYLKGCTQSLWAIHSSPVVWLWSFGTSTSHVPLHDVRASQFPCREHNTGCAPFEVKFCFFRTPHNFHLSLAHTPHELPRSWLWLVHQLLRESFFKNSTSLEVPMGR